MPTEKEFHKEEKKKLAARDKRTSLTFANQFYKSDEAFTYLGY